MLQEDLSQKKHEPDNIDRCVKAAKKLSEEKGKYITYGQYMGMYHTEKSAGRKKDKK